MSNRPIVRKGWLVVGLVSATLLSSCASHTTRPVSTSGAVSQYAATHPNVLAAGERVVQAQAGQTIAQADLLPQVNLTASHTTYMEDATGSTARTGEQNLGLSASWSLSDAFAGVSGVKAAKFATLAAREAVRGSTDQTIVELVRTKSAIISATEISKIRVEHKSELNSYLSQQKRRYQTGEISATELQTIRGRIKFVDSELVRLRSEIAANSAKLKALAGNIPLDNIVVADLARFVPKSEVRAREVALSRNPGLREAELRQNAASENYAKATRDLAPDLSVSFNTSQTGTQYVGNTATTGNGSNVRLDLTVPLFDGGRRLANVNLERSKFREQTYTAQAQKLSTTSDASGQWRGVMAAREMRNLADGRVEINRKALSGTLAGARIGARTVNQVLQAFESLVDARIASVDAQSQVILRTHELLETLGFLSEAYSSI